MAERIIKVKVAELVIGDVIAKDVYNQSGGILVTKNTDVNETVIQRLLKSYNEPIFVYRNVSDSFNTTKINIYQILLSEIEDIINTTSRKFIKQNKDIGQIKKVIFEILENENTIKLLLPIRPLGSNVFNHSINVALYSLLVGKETYMPINKLKVLGTAALLHDIGMQKIPKDIIFKGDSLNEDEKKLLKLHPRFSFELLQETNRFNLEISSIVLQHHERYDGRGYPNGIKNERIHELAKIINICDIFDALTNDRPYRQKFEKEESIEYLLSAGEQYSNPEIIQGLINNISLYPFGQWVKISTGETGVIVSHEEESSIKFRPKVMIYIDKQGKELMNPILIDLSLRSNSNITIENII